ncbi:MAG: DUF6458 family protein [Micromonosporaceae bacterium]
MGIGASIFLIALGAIVAFGVEFSLGWLDLNVVGFVLMLAGITGLAVTFNFWNRRRNAQQVVEERHYYGGRATPPPDRGETVHRRETVQRRGSPPR